MARSEKIAAGIALLVMVLISLLCANLLHLATLTCENIRIMGDRNVADMQMRSSGKVQNTPVPDTCKEHQFPWIFG